MYSAEETFAEANSVLPRHDLWEDTCNWQGFYWTDEIK